MDAFNQALNRAVELLSRRDLTSGKVREHLTPHFEAEIVAQALEHLKRKGMVNDERFALTFARKHSDYSSDRLRMELSQRGAEAEAIRAVIQTLETDREKCSRLARELCSLPPLKLARKLSALGYDPELIENAIEETFELS